MAEKLTDLRVIRTKGLIEEALLALIEEKGFEGVNVRSLTEKAGINRGTFYLHYQDIFYLLDHIEAELIAGMESQSAQWEWSIVDSVYQVSENEPFATIMSFFNYLNEHARWFRIIFSSTGTATFGTKLKSLIRTRMFEKIPPELVEAKSSEVPPDYLIAYFSAAHFGLIQHWFETGQALSPSEMALMLTRLIREGPMQTALNMRTNDVERNE